MGLWLVKVRVRWETEGFAWKLFESNRYVCLRTSRYLIMLCDARRFTGESRLVE